MKYRLGDLTLRNWNDWDRVPRDPVTIGAAILGQTVGTTAIIAGITGQMIVGYLVTSVITSWALSALMPQPDFSSFGSQGTLVNAREAAAAADFVYGEVRKGGTVVFYESTGEGNKYLHQVIAMAAHEINAIGDIYINDEVVSWNASTGLVSGDWDDKIRIRKHLGDQTTADAELVSETSAGATFVGNGIAYLYVRYEYDRDVFANGLPLVTAKIQGKKVYDPRSETTAYSNNAALCMRDFLVSEYGLNDSAIDDVSFSVAANESDEDVTLAAGGTEKRYTINGIVKSSSPIGKVLGDMSTACAGTLFWGSGYWKLKVGAYSSPVKTLTLDDLRGPISMKTRTSVRDSFNGVSGTFNDAEQDFITADYPPIQSDIFKAEDGGDELMLDLPLPFTTSAATAQRIAKLTLYRAREQISITADFGLNAFDIEVGDIIAFDNERYGFDGKEFEVMGWRFESNQDAGDLRVSLALQETSEAAFAWDGDETAIINNNTTLLKYNEVPNIGLNAVARTRTLNEKVTNFISATVSASASEVALIDYVEVQYKQSSDDNYGHLGTGQLGVFEAVDLDNGLYDFRARAVNAFGYHGQWEYLGSIEALGDVSPPDTVSSFSSDVNGQTINLNWEPVSNADLSFYRVRHAIEETGATWSNATTAVDRVARPSTSVVLPIRAGTYMIRAYDKEGLPSEAATPIIVPSEVMPTFSNTSTQTDTTTFSGTKTGCSVSSGRLVITDTSSAPSEATYEFASIIDSGSIGKRFCRIRCGTLRQDNSSGLWDDMQGDWNSWAGLWDDWTGFSQYADTDVLFYVAVSNDAPASPTWSDWSQFRAGDIYGRLFKFKIVLKSTSESVTPSIGDLEAIVEWN